MTGTVQPNSDKASVVIHATWLKIFLSLLALGLMAIGSAMNVSSSIGAIRATQQEHSETLQHVAMQNDLRDQMRPLREQVDRISGRVDAIYRAVGGNHFRLSGHQRN